MVDGKPSNRVEPHLAAKDRSGVRAGRIGSAPPPAGRTEPGRRNLFWRLCREARPCRVHIAGLLALSLVSPPLALLAPLPLKLAVDSVIGSQPLPGFLAYILPAAVVRSSAALLLVVAGLVVVVALLAQLRDCASTLLTNYTGEKLLRGFRAKLFRQAQRLSLSYHDTRGTADSTYRIQYDATCLQNIVVEGVVPFVTSTFTLMAMISVTARINWKLALVGLAVSPLIFVVSRASRRRLRRQSREIRKLESSALSVVQEVLGAARVVKAFGQEEREQERFVERSNAGMRARLRQALTEGGFGLVVALCTAAGMAGVLYLGVLDIKAGRLTLGSLLLVLGYLGQLYAPLKTISKKMASMQSHLAGAERAFALLDEAPDVVERPDARTLARAAGAVTFRQVCFAYEPGRPVLQNISSAVPAGARVAIAGATGAGKTTLVNLLTRFYDPAGGQILLDGHDLREYKVADLRNQFAIVLQEPLLFSTSIAENIAYARPGAGESEVIAAARAANAHDFIQRLPDGYDTLVGERGLKLSGGERQRISLARAFLKDAPILILDEPTSSVDAGTEANILEAMERLMRGRTTFIIAHRESLLHRCSHRLDLEQGRLVERARAAAHEAPVACDAAPCHARVPASQTDKGATPVARGLPPQEAQSALDAWRKLCPGSPLPQNIENLKHTAKSFIYRLEGIGEGGGAVIAKRCVTPTAVLETQVYEECLPRMPWPSLRWYGSVPDSSQKFRWLFVEDAGKERCTWSLPEHRAAGARWMARLHAGAAGLTAASRLPERGAAYYLRQLQRARANILDRLGHQALQPEHVRVLRKIVTQCDFLESRWGEVERLCSEAPPTLVHGDLKEKNIGLRSTPEGPACLPFDWETSGWAVPAVDLAKCPDLSSYQQLIGDSWPALAQCDLRRLAQVGGLFRALVATHWKTISLDFIEPEWAEWLILKLRMYSVRLTASAETLDLT